MSIERTNLDHLFDTVHVGTNDGSATFAISLHGVNASFTLGITDDALELSMLSPYVASQTITSSALSVAVGLTFGTGASACTYTDAQVCGRRSPLLRGRDCHARPFSCTVPVVIHD